MAELGFNGGIPCAQRAGEQKFYDASLGHTPQDILYSGEYRYIFNFIFTLHTPAFAAVVAAAVAANTGNAAAVPLP